MLLPTTTATAGVALNVMMAFLQGKPLLVRLAVDNNDRRAVVVVNRRAGGDGGLARISIPSAYFSTVVALPSTDKDFSAAEYGGNAV